jgi:hypothetical protein
VIFTVDPQSGHLTATGQQLHMDQPASVFLVKSANTSGIGHPHVIDTTLDKAIEFNGIDDALLIGEHPLAGAEARVAPRTARVSSLGAGSCNRTGHRWALVI